MNPPPDNTPKTAKTAKTSAKKRGGFFVFFSLIFLIGGVGYLFYEIEHLKKSRDNDSPAAEIAALNGTIDANDSRLRVLEQKNERLNAQIAKLAARRPSSVGGGLDNATRLQLIDLNLRVSGDTLVAANALRRWAESSSEQNGLAAEIARLENGERRARLFFEIGKLNALLNKSPAAETVAALADDGLGGKIKQSFLSFYNVKQSAKQHSPARRRLRAALRRLEFLLLAGRHDDYRAQLPRIKQLWQNADVDDGDSNLQSQFNLLMQMNVPDYRLNLPGENF